MITNAAIVITSLLTNLTENVHPDGSKMAVITTVTKQCVHEWSEDGIAHCHTNSYPVKTVIKHYQRTWQLIETVRPTPPMPSSSVAPIPNRNVSFVLASGEPIMLTGTFSAPLPPPDDVEMFMVSFPTETNRIYRFEGTKDLVTWQYLPPELDGTGQPDTFYDKHEGISAYRVVSREGVLPVED